MEKAIDTNIKRIAIVGPESTGKSTLAAELAKHYHTVFVPEYAREYISNLKRPYTLDDIVIISKKQLELEDQLATKATKLLICDTNLVVTKVWAEFKYRQCPQWIAETITQRQYDLHLLCNIDFPWEDDPLREHPQQREELFAIYKNELEKLKTPYSIVSGLGSERMKNAVEAIDAALKKQSPLIH